ncbi:MAG: hypothetical protein Q9166_005865 [cf. Caloplaca sp. 2 TL-2023]
MPLPTSSSTITTSILPPPGPSVLSLRNTLLASHTHTHTTFPIPPPNTPALFLSALAVRIPVFITEQKCSLDGEIDADDARSWHWVAFSDSQPVATLRLVPVPTTNAGGMLMEKGERRSEPYYRPTKLWDGVELYIKIGRMATLSSHRGQGIARRLLEESMVWAAAHPGELLPDADAVEGMTLEWNGLVLSHAQKSVQGWWEKMGFQLDEGLGVWWEEGIEHVGMWRRLQLEDEALSV